MEHEDGTEPQTYHGKIDAEFTLEPCPFCGSEDVWFGPDGDSYELDCVGCELCGARSRACPTDNYRAARAVISSWNRRV